MNYTNNIKKTSYRAIVGLVFVFIMLFGIGFGAFGENRVEASNVYISNIQFYKGADDLAHIKFFVNTSFNINYTAVVELTNFSRCSVDQEPYGILNESTPRFTIVVPTDENYEVESLCGNTFTYTAGQTYDHIVMGAGRELYFNKTTGRLCLKNNCVSNYDLITTLGRPLTSTDYYIHLEPYSAWPTKDDTEKYYFTETPTLNITYPFENAEISEAFNIQGSYTIPAGSGYDKIVAYIGAGIPYAQYSFIQNLTDPNGNINIRVSGLPAGDYSVYFYFMGDNVENYFVENATIHFSILSSIPPELPETQETPPEFYNVIDAETFYLENSTYATSTALYLNLKNATQPIFTVIGSNLVFFTSNFDQETAKETGQKTGQAILTFRTYSDNLNTFFNDLPVSEFLLFYLSLLIIVVVFRIIKNLINLIKP